MKTLHFFIFLFLIALAAMTGFNVLVSEAAPASAKVNKDVCLGCHGPFDKLTTAPKTFTDESGDKINPHRYVPHNKQDAKSVPECTNCHTPHPVPLQEKKDVTKPGIDSCYGCHHMRDFSDCKSCHK
jgi:predicted CXXCH cytochrome family protein